MSISAASDTFLYFGFGSNLLKERLQLLNPSAVFRTTAKLKDYKLSFNYSNEPLDRSRLGWCGCPATIETEQGRCVWGVVWELSKADLSNLDRQEGVDEGIYKPIEVTVESVSKQLLTCRTYDLQLKGDGDNRPSPQYMDVIIKGALQNNLPDDYISQLKSIEHNGHSGRVAVYEEVLKTLNVNTSS